MTENLTIRNFGPIKNASIDLRRYVLFIGAQASGKSTVAKLLSIFRNVDVYFLREDPIVTNNDIKTLIHQLNISDYFQYNSFIEYKNDNYSIKYDNSSWRISKTPEFDALIKSEIGRIENLLKEFSQNNERNKGLPPEEQEKYAKSLFDFNWKNLFAQRKNQIYIPADRMLVSLIFDSAFSFNDVSLPGSLKSFGLKFQSARARVREFEINFLKIKFKYEEGKGDNHKIYHDSNNFVSLSDSSSGIQTILPLMLVVEDLTNPRYPTPSSFIVEEPELNLFPTTQKEVLNFLIQKSSLNKASEIVITTHSPYILSSLNILLLAYIIGSKDSEIEKTVSSLIDKSTWINPNEFNAFYFSDGNVSEIFDRKINLISNDELDNVSDNIGGAFEELMSLYKTNKKNEKSN